MNTSKNPLRSTVMADITNTILKKHVKNSELGTEYWSCTEQEEQLVGAYDKWLKNSTVWLAALLKVHAALETHETSQ